MKDETREAREMRAALLSHARSMRWIIARLENLGLEPLVTHVRVDRDEVVLVTPYAVLHEPKDEATLRGSYEQAKARVWGATEATERLSKELLEGGP